MIVRQFISWIRTAPAGERAEATRALARAWLISDLSEDDRIAAEANRDRFGGGPQPPRPLIEQRPHHHILGDERRFEIEIAPHRTGVRSRFLCSWQANSRVRP